MFLWKTVQHSPHSLIQFFLFWICKIQGFSMIESDFIFFLSSKYLKCSLIITINFTYPWTPSALCPVWLWNKSTRQFPDENFHKEAEVRTSLLSNSGKPPSSKLFLSSLQHFTDPPTLNRPVSLRPKHKHTFYKYTQPLHTSDKHWETLTMLLHKLHNVCEHQRKTLPHLSALSQADEGHTEHGSWCFHLHKHKKKKSGIFNLLRVVLHSTPCMRRVFISNRCTF